MSFNFSLHFCPKFSLAFGGALQVSAVLKIEGNEEET